MEFQDRIELARGKMLQVERELENYFRNARYDPEQEKKLVDAVKASRDGYVDKLALLFPDINLI